MKDVKLTIESNIKVAPDIYLMRLVGDTSEIKNSGEFINITIPGYYLRRPISVSRYTKNSVDILYKILGRGTKDLSSFEKGMKLDTLVGLGNGFDLSKAKKPLLIGGGIGIAPMFSLIDEFNNMNIKPTVIFGARTKDDLVLIDELEKISDLHICTDDGSLGFKGNAVEYLKTNNISYDYYYACGPLPMLKALKNYDQNGCLSLEARMGCGFGACMGCSIKTTKGAKRVCKEGPVFEASEVLFDEN